LGNVVTNRCLAQIDYTDIVLNDHTLKEKNLDITSLYGTNESPPTDTQRFRFLGKNPSHSSSSERNGNHRKL